MAATTTAPHYKQPSRILASRDQSNSRTIIQSVIQVGCMSRQLLLNQYKTMLLQSIKPSVKVSNLSEMSITLILQFSSGLTQRLGVVFVI